MRVVCISDTHNCNLEKLKLPEGDILLHSGDFSMNGTIPEVSQFNEQCGKIKNRYTHGIYTCAGNHDFLAETDEALCRSLMPNCNLLIDKSIEIDGVKFYFSPWTPWFFSWAFNFEEQNIEQAQRCWANIPDDTNVLITHGPPRKILDRTPDHYAHMGRNVGCGQLFSRTVKLRNLLLHSFGHIHCSYGHEKFENTLYVNASICTEQYRPTNPAYVVDIDTVHMQVERLTNAKEDLENSAHT